MGVEFIIDNHHQTSTLGSLEQPQEDIEVVEVVEDIEDPLEQIADVTSDETEAVDNPDIFYSEDTTNGPDIIEEIDNEIIIENFDMEDPKEEVEPSLDISNVGMTPADVVDLEEETEINDIRKDEEVIPMKFYEGVLIKLAKKVFANEK